MINKGYMRKENIEKFYDDYAEYYEIVYNDYLKKSEKVLKDLIKYIKTLNNIEKWILIDLGCGIGRQLKFLKDQLQGKCLKAIGVDISNSMLKLAKTRDNNIQWLKKNILDKNLKNDIQELIYKKHLNRENIGTLITCLGNTLAHIPKEKYGEFINNLKELCGITKNSIAVLEIRNGKKLKNEKPSIEVLSWITFNDNFYLSFYFMTHQKDKYPTDVYLIGGKKKAIKSWHNDVSYYVWPDKLENFLKNDFSILKNKINGKKIISPLKFGEIWIVKKKK
jgi:SAM-dependent methyltransferase